MLHSRTRILKVKLSNTMSEKVGDSWIHTSTTMVISLAAGRYSSARCEKGTQLRPVASAWYMARITHSCSLSCTTCTRVSAPSSSSTPAPAPAPTPGERVAKGVLGAPATTTMLLSVAAGLLAHRTARYVVISGSTSVKSGMMVGDVRGRRNFRPRMEKVSAVPKKSTCGAAAAAFLDLADTLAMNLVHSRWIFLWNRKPRTIREMVTASRTRSEVRSCVLWNTYTAFPTLTACGKAAMKSFATISDRYSTTWKLLYSISTAESTSLRTISYMSCCILENGVVVVT
mmetsp:Transcript_30958/g.68377  ORF Transcript_30958/g.68377 Transcript_30958/m.68377 type:complete len:286 (-) Transcript_30958:142-999(-)